MTCVLVVNSGSSSLKYELVDVESATELTSGVIERIGEPVSMLSSKTGSARTESQAEITNHQQAFSAMVGMLDAADIDLAAHPIAAVGHRVVHGGDLFFEPVLIDDAVMTAIDELSVLAPLHNPANLAGIRAARLQFAAIPHVAVFDTAFHQTMPPEAYTYAIDRDLAEMHSVRRYGFHGTSHQSAARAAAEHLQWPLSELKQIILHLGNGASMAAVDGGRSIDTSMGMSPLAGLVMGTRSGDIDPSVLSHLNREAGLSVAELDRLLNKQSGMFGLTGFTDMRDVQRAADAGDQDAQLGIDVYVHRIRHYLGAYLLELGGADAIVFTAGVGEHQAEIRAAVLEGLEWLGIELDAELNASRASTVRTISAPTSRTAVLVVPADEEREIARKVLSLL